MEIMISMIGMAERLSSPLHLLYSARYVENNQVQAPNKTFIM